MQSTGATTRFNQVLPDGKSVLVTTLSRGGISYDYADIHLFSLETLESRLLIESGYDARYVSSGHLLFARSGSLLAVAFDIERLEVSGQPVPVVSDVGMESFFNQAQVTFSDSGSLLYVPGGDFSRGLLASVDRRGNAEFLPMPERLYGVFDLAPNGNRLAIQVADINDFIWIYDMDRQEGRRLTATGAAFWPVWSPNGTSIAFSSKRPGDLWKILRQDLDTRGASEELFTNPRPTSPNSWTPNGQVLAVSENSDDGLIRIGFLSVEDFSNPKWPLAGGSNSWGAAFFPDGRWLAYGSDETGRYEVWVRSFPDGDTVRQISVDGGIEPVWCRECDELFWRRGNQWFASAITLEPELSWEPPRKVFETDFVDTPGRSYDVSLDGERLLVVKRTREPVRTKLHVVLNWFEESERLVPTH